MFSCRDFDGKVTPEEVAAAAMYLKDTLGKEGIQELISSLSKDKGIFFAVLYSLFYCRHFSFSSRTEYTIFTLFLIFVIFVLFVCLFFVFDTRSKESLKPL